MVRTDAAAGCCGADEALTGAGVGPIGPTDAEPDNGPPMPPATIDAAVRPAIFFEFIFNPHFVLCFSDQEY